MNYNKNASSRDFRSVIGDYDIRGCVGENFGVDQAYMIGLGFGSIVQCKGGKNIAVGYDRRESSVDFKEAYIEGLLDSGANAISLGRTSTAYTTLAYHMIGADASTMITASHNPIRYNGFKFHFKGQNFYGRELLELYDRIKNDVFSSGRGKLSQANYFQEYSHYLLQNINLSSNIPAIWDAGHGVAGDILPYIKKNLPNSHILYRTDENENAKDFDNTKVEFLNHTHKELAEKKDYIAFAFDGDADRMVVIDEKGKVWNGDELLTLFSVLIRCKSNKNETVTTIWDSKSSQMLMKWAKEFDVKPVLSKTGHCYVINAIKQNDAALGGEMSGHYMFQDSSFAVDDGIYSALRLLDMLSYVPYKLCDFASAMPKVWASRLLRVQCKNLEKNQVMEYIKESLSRANTVIEIVHDSIVVNHHNGWWMVRASQTENVISARCEGWNESGFEEVKSFMEVTLSSCGLSF